MKKSTINKILISTYVTSSIASYFTVGFLIYYKMTIESLNTFEEVNPPRYLMRSASDYLKIKRVNCAKIPIFNNIDYSIRDKSFFKKLNKEAERRLPLNGTYYFEQTMNHLGAGAQHAVENFRFISSVSSFLTSPFKNHRMWLFNIEINKSFYDYKKANFALSASYSVIRPNDAYTKMKPELLKENGEEYYHMYAEKILIAGCKNRKREMGFKSWMDEAKAPPVDYYLNPDDTKHVVAGFKAFYELLENRANKATIAYENAMKDRWKFHLLAFLFSLFPLTVIATFQVMKKRNIPFWGEDPKDFIKRKFKK